MKSGAGMRSDYPKASCFQGSGRKNIPATPSTSTTVNVDHLVANPPPPLFKHIRSSAGRMIEMRDPPRLRPVATCGGQLSGRGWRVVLWSPRLSTDTK